MTVDCQGRKIVVAMSGGVDSSTIAALLPEQGEEVIGINRRLFASEEGKPKALGDGKRVAT